ncbi:UDP-N-acetylmuramate dehydrogenase [Candidatus Microgenomates bacterium]|nr:MAG: UDP-N-acetylmuramate dehydrogenase [Candidatus Microgenomates bacterium]
MNKKLQELKDVFGENRIRENELMSLHTTFKIGGPAQYYLEVDKIEDLVKAVKTANGLKIPYFILGGGSNILVSDKGFGGLVIKNNCRKFEVMQMGGRVKNNAEKKWEIDLGNTLVYAESGVIMNQLVRFTIDEGLRGLEYQLGLPGTVGGAVFMNSNFPKKEAYVGDYVFKAKLLTNEGILKDADKSYFHFGYDKSFLQESNEVLLSVVFKLGRSEKKDLWDKGMEAIEHRNVAYPKMPSAGCVFRNISIAQAMNIPTPSHVTSSGYLIDKAGLKGKKVGNAMVSKEHANFIINLGGAKADDVLSLIESIKEAVFKKFGVNLEMEIKKIGFN